MAENWLKWSKKQPISEAGVGVYDEYAALLWRLFGCLDIMTLNNEKSFCYGAQSLLQFYIDWKKKETDHKRK